MTLSETRAMIEARPDATPAQWATLAGLVVPAVVIVPGPWAEDER